MTESESNALRELYASLRRQEIPHEEAFRLTLARVLVAPAFLYRAERPNPGTEPAPVSDWELASRLSYFLWSSQPDDELKRLPPKVGCTSQTSWPRRRGACCATRRRNDWRPSSPANGCTFTTSTNSTKRAIATFRRSSICERPCTKSRFSSFTHLFTENQFGARHSLDADYTYLNEELAKHYGIPGVDGPGWRRVDGVKKYARGGVLAQATTLAKQSGASRTSPILRGNWISEVLLGERLPKPPKGVPPLPDDEAATDGLTVRQLVEKHVSDPKCSVCHRRIDPYGFSLEEFDAIGRYREKDLGDRPIDARVPSQ